MLSLGQDASALALESLGGAAARDGGQAGAHRPGTPAGLLRELCQRPSRLLRAAALTPARLRLLGVQPLLDWNRVAVEGLPAQVPPGEEPDGAAPARLTRLIELGKPEPPRPRPHDPEPIRPTRAGRSAPAIHLRDDERERLEGVVRAATSSQRDALRARILLLAAQGKTNREIAAELGVGEKTAGKWRRRFRQEGPRGLRDAPRSGRPPIYSAEQKAWFLQKALESARDNGIPVTHWSSQELVDFAKRAGISPVPDPATLARWLNGADIQPHRWRYWLQITDPDFETRMKDVTGLYLRAIALHKAGIPVFCVDEKTGIQALERDVPDRPLRPGKPVRREHRYKRRGTACLIGVFHVATGRVWGRFTTNRTAKTVAALLTEVCESVPNAPEIHFVMDQASTHWHLEVCRVVARLSKVRLELGKLKTGCQRKEFLLRPDKRIMFHFTPRRASWLDQIEIWFSVLARKVLERGSFTSVADLQAKVYEYIDHYNRFDAHPYRWTYTGTPCRS